ncbi:MAG: GNAT family N-acetyltransferase [Planctomycetota bacterium]
MSATHPPAAKIEALEKRWEGEEYRLRAIAKDLRAGRDWTVHLRGLPLVEEVPPRPGEAYGRDLRGADLHHYLRPEVEVGRAEEHKAPLVAAISLEGLRNNTPLPDVSPFPVEVEGAGEIALAMRRGERFLLARCDREPVGVIRSAQHRQFEEYTADRPYIELSGLAVLARWRRSGIGTRLIERAERLAAQDGFDHVVLRTTREIGLVPWYERMGYVVKLTRQLSYPDAPTCLDVLMVKRLATAGAQPLPGTRGRLRIVKAAGRAAGRAGSGSRSYLAWGGGLR